MYYVLSILVNCGKIKYLGSVIHIIFISAAVIFIGNNRFIGLLDFFSQQLPSITQSDSA